MIDGCQTLEDHLLRVKDYARCCLQEHEGFFGYLPLLILRLQRIVEVLG
jgi:hypothetical protein